MPFFKALRCMPMSAAEKLHQKQQQQQPNNGSSAAADNYSCCSGRREIIIPPAELSNGRQNAGPVHHQDGLALAPNQQQPQLAFYCQLAHGSTTGLISGFGSVRELYSKIAHCFDIRPEEILFCTLNTHKIDMSELVGGQIGLDDFIFAHKKGRAKEIELIKSEDALGLTLTDNGAGYVFIKRITSNSIMDRLQDVVQVGDHIEKLNGLSLVGKRHYEVARMLKQLERGSALLIRLVEPLSRSGFGIIGPRCAYSAAAAAAAAGPRSRSKLLGLATHGQLTGRETLRFRADGLTKIESIQQNEADLHDNAREQIEQINDALESYMGISDNVLARRLWEIAQNKINSMDLAKAIDSSMQQQDSFDFSEDFVFQVWKIVFGARNHLH